MHTFGTILERTFKWWFYGKSSTELNQVEGKYVPGGTKLSKALHGPPLLRSVYQSSTHNLYRLQILSNRRYQRGSHHRSRITGDHDKCSDRAPMDLTNKFSWKLGILHLEPHLLLAFNPQRSHQQTAIASQLRWDCCT